MSQGKFAAAISALALSSCATTSFGPGTPLAPTVTSRDLAGGIAYVGTFVSLYRDRANAAANGRQWFEVPAFLAVFGGAVASATGGSDGGLIGAGVASLANAGNGYYAPRTKAALYRQAGDAMVCVQQVGSGLQAYSITQKTMALAGAGGELTTYLEMQGAAWAIERILGERLSNTGALPDAAGLAAQFEKLVTEREAKAKAAGDQAKAAGATSAADLAAETARAASAVEAARTTLAAAEAEAAAARAEAKADVDGDGVANPAALTSASARVSSARARLDEAMAAQAAIAEKRNAAEAATAVLAETLAEGLQLHANLQLCVLRMKS